MSLTKTYTKTPCALDRLIQEVQINASITVALNYETTNLLGDQLTVGFRADMSDWSAVDTLVTAHTGVPLVQPPQVVKIDQPVDADLAPITRSKTTRPGWHFQPRWLTFQSAKYGSLHNKKIDTITDYGDGTLKFWKIVSNAWVELKLVDYADEAALQAALDTDCTITTMDWYTTFDFDIRGGVFLNGVRPTTPTWAYACVAPDVPAAYGGSVPFLDGGVPIHLLPDYNLIPQDGGTVKSFAYDAVNKTNKIRFTVAHAAGVKTDLAIAFQIFKL